MNINEIRYELAMERLGQIPAEEEVSGAFRPFFADAAKWLLRMDSVLNSGDRRGLYEDILPGAYERSWASPAFCSDRLGRELGQPAAVLFYELRGCIPFAVRGKKDRLLIRMELLLELYTAFATAFREGEDLPRRQDVCGIMGLYLSDYARDEEYARLMDLYDKEISSADRVLGGIDLRDPCCIGSLGKYVSEQDRAEADGICGCSCEEIRKTASSAVKSWKERMEEAGFDPSRSETVILSAPLGYARAASVVSEILGESGITALLPSGEQTLFYPWQNQSCGLWETAANPQFLSDHKEDLALFLDPLFLNRKQEGIREAQNDARTAAEACAKLPLEIAPEREKERRTLLQTVPGKSSAAPSMSAKQRRLEAQLTAAVSPGGIEFSV